MIRAIVFDMDGIIIDSHPIHLRAWKTFLQTAGREVSDDELDFILDGRKREEILRYFLGELTPAQIAEHGAHKDEMLRLLAEDMQPLPGVVDFLDSLCQLGIRIGLATSAGTRRVHGTLKDLGLSHYFDAIVTGDEVTNGKPDPAIYLLVAERLNEAPENLLAVEDAVSGIKAARGAGMRCVGIASADRSQSLRAAGADPVVPDFHSLSLEQLELSLR